MTSQTFFHPMKILHTADIHIGYDTHGRLDPATGLSTRWGDFKSAFEFMVARAIKEDIDLFLFCGDAYRDSTPTPTEQRIFSQCLRPLLEAKIPVVMLVGNHDHPVSFGRVSSIDIFPNLIGNVVLFSKPGVKDIETKSGKVRVVGLPWPVRSNLMSKDEYAKLTPEELKQKIYEIYTGFVDVQAEAIRSEKLTYPAILAAHLEIDTAVFSNGSEKVTIITKDPQFSVQSLAKPEFSYVGLGHVHKHQELNNGQHPPVVYSGSIERISFSEHDQAKGFVMVEIDAGHRASFRHVQTPARPFVSIECDVTVETEPMEKILREIDRNKLTGMATAFEGAVVRVRIKCKDAQKSQIDTDVIRQSLSGAFTISELSLLSEEQVRRIRAVEMTRFMSTGEALEKYIVQNEKLKPLREKILRAAAELEAEEHGVSAE
ncbi:MAG: exonuclease SbcCD subunit D [Rhizobacter sp.]|nr:exonuclease SbcCD subunit D [Chlorobiales bacterium]